MKNIDNWIFHYNTLQGQWRAVTREHYKDLFNDNDSPYVLRSTSVETLMDIINRTNGDTAKIAKLVS